MNKRKSQQIENKNYLIDNLNVDVESLDGELLGIKMPEKLEMKVVSIDSSATSGSSSNQTKDTIMETGLVVKVPMFINEGETIIVTTADGKYYSRG